MPETPPTTPYRPLTDTSAETMRWYGLLPAFYRDYDEIDTTVEGGYPLLRFMDSIGWWFTEVTKLMDRFRPSASNPLSDLIDPAGADARWISWLSQLVGVSSVPTSGPVADMTASWGYLQSLIDSNANSLSEWTEWEALGTWQAIEDADLVVRAQMFSVRETIARRRGFVPPEGAPADYTSTDAYNGYGYYDGTAKSIELAIEPILGGTKYVWVGGLADLHDLDPAYASIPAVAPEWTRIHILTRPAESPSPGTILEVAEHVRPAGFEYVHHDTLV